MTDSLRNEKGVALALVLVLSAIMLALMAGLVYLITTGTQISGSEKRYRTALEAATGGADVTFQLIGERADPGIPGINLFLAPLFTSTCLTDKLNENTAGWNPACDKSLTIDPATPATYDIRFDLGQYRVYTKIVETVEGNSGPDLGLVKNPVVDSTSGEITVKSIPYLYAIEIDSENPVNTAERAKLSVLYQY